MSTLEITSATTGWQERIAEHLALGERVVVRFEAPSLSPREVAESLGVSRPAVMRWIKEGRLATRRVGTYHRIDKAELERFRSVYIRDLAEASRAEIEAELYGVEQ